MSKGNKKGKVTKPFLSEKDEDDLHENLIEMKNMKINEMIKDTIDMSRDVLTIGKFIDQDNKRIDRLNNRTDAMTKKGERNLQKMKTYLEKTSPCKIWIIIGIEAFLFICLMSL
jgi:hypothetical protein